MMRLGLYKQRVIHDTGESHYLPNASLLRTLNDESMFDSFYYRTDSPSNVANLINFFVNCLLINRYIRFYNLHYIVKLQNLPIFLNKGSVKNY